MRNLKVYHWKEQKVTSADCTSYQFATPFVKHGYVCTTYRSLEKILKISSVKSNHKNY